jgi:ubiquitin carboxyl-terminal hydrolase 8
LQCLSATEPFSTFFRDGRWKRSVNFNNNLGTKGNLASAYSSLISALWQQEYHFIQPLSFRVCPFPAHQLGAAAVLTPLVPLVI